MRPLPHLVPSLFALRSDTDADSAAHKCKTKPTFTHFTIHCCSVRYRNIRFTYPVLKFRLIVGVEEGVKGIVIVPSFSLSSSNIRANWMVG